MIRREGNPLTSVRIMGRVSGLSGGHLTSLTHMRLATHVDQEFVDIRRDAPLIYLRAVVGEVGSDDDA